MSKFKAGDWVETLDDNIRGKVLSLNGSTVQLEDSDGFVMEFQEVDLIKIPESQIHAKIDWDDVTKARLHKELGEKKRKTVPKTPKKRTENIFSVDLHIEKLVDSTKGMTNYDMLNLQLDTARKQLDFAIKKNMQRMVFIHGVGEGVLKMELYTLLRRYDHIKFYDADFRTYGYGATEVRIYKES
ncbi:Smr/MutS family protein [Winogradskyella aurantiaca]|uniref:Smr/MutS family protein n=1 Tax=Winogradskyella aurantiaca TaxID=2219558 RepID=UPI000E1D7A5F|nr:Smr/MutS family protein [Winogradskyella aurantiaca]